MNSRIVNWLSLFGVLFLYGCADKTQQNEDVLFPNTIVDSFEEKETTVNDLLGEYRIIDLETSDESLIGGRSNKVIKRGDNIFVKSMNEVLSFDSEGKYKGKLSKTGKGPEEYDQILDFDVTPDNGEIWVSATDKIVRYALPSFEYIGSVPVSFYANKIKCMDNGYFLAVCPDDKVFNLCSPEGRIQDSFLDKDLANSSTMAVQFVKIGNAIVSQLSSSNTAVCYDIINGTFTLSDLLPNDEEKIETVEINRQYFDKYGYLDFTEAVRQRYRGIVSFRKLGDQSIVSLVYPEREGAVIIDNGKESRQFYVRSNNKQTLLNDLSDYSDSSFMMQFAGCDSEDSFLFVMPSENPENNFSLLEVLKFK